MKLSVIIPVAAYNTKWLNVAIESAVPFADEIVMVCDDLEIHQLALGDKRVTHVLTVTSPKGPEMAINAGIAVSIGTHFSVLCSDDRYLPDMAKVKAAADGMVVTYGGVKFAGDMSGLPTWPVSDLQLGALRKENCVPSPAIVPKRWWHEVGGYENVRYADWHFYKKLYGCFGLSAFCFKRDWLFYEYHAWPGTISARYGYRSDLGHEW